ncbi:hypothetical protein ACWUKX_30225, partial [Mesorhizobium sp. f-mel]
MAIAGSSIGAIMGVGMGSALAGQHPRLCLLDPSAAAEAAGHLPPFHRLESEVPPCPNKPLATLPMWRVDHIEPSPEMLALCANGPIHRVRFPSGHEGWWVTGYDEAKAVLSDAAFRP